MINATAPSETISRFISFAHGLNLSSISASISQLSQLDGTSSAIRNVLKGSPSTSCRLACLSTKDDINPFSSNLISAKGVSS